LDTDTRRFEGSKERDRKSEFQIKMEKKPFENFDSWPMNSF